MEVWKDIQGFEGIYKISNQGRIKKFYKTANPIIINGYVHFGVLMVNLCYRGQKKVPIRKLVVVHFIDRFDGYMDKYLYTKNIDSDIYNNRLENITARYKKTEDNRVYVTNSFTRLTESDRKNIVSSFYRTDLREGEKVVDNRDKTISNELGLDEKLVSGYIQHILELKYRNWKL